MNIISNFSLTSFLYKVNNTIKKQITLQNCCASGTVHSFVFKLHSSLAHITLLSHLTHNLIASPPNHCNITPELQLGKM